MIYRFKIKKGEHKTSKILFCSIWFKATDSLEAIAKKDEYLVNHPEYAEYYVTWESRKPKEKSTVNTLTKEQVIEIKEALANGIRGINNRRIGGYLSQKYGVSRQTISHIKQGKTWQNA